VTVAAVAIHGYHLGAEDAEIYLPAARKFLHPELYPFAPEFFLSHSHLSMFGPFVGGFSALMHLSLDWTFFICYIVSLFATIAACWLLLDACFSSARARWCALLTTVAVLSMPATNTALLLFDPYLTARSLSTPLALFALASALEHRCVRAGVAVALTVAVHPQMASYLAFIIGTLWVKELREKGVRTPVPVHTVAFALVPMSFHLARSTGAYREALFSRDYFFLYNWAWYHWLGMLAPLAFLTWFGRADLRGTRPAMRHISFALVVAGVLSILIAVVFSTSPNFEMFARLQPLRAFHLITFVFVLFATGVFGEYVAKDRAWVVASICLPLAVGMYIVQRRTYLYSSHIEFPSRTSNNAWVNALLWIRQNTPTNAVFAIDSRYFTEHPADEHGFRSISERSALADYHKDSGVVCLFPALADEWKQMSGATYGLNHFSLVQFRWLKQQYPEVSWTVIHGAAPFGLTCPYQQSSYSVCQMP